MQSCIACFVCGVPVAHEAADQLEPPPHLGEDEGGDGGVHAARHPDGHSEERHHCALLCVLDSQIAKDHMYAPIAENKWNG